jgi:hypothetical protein
MKVDVGAIEHPLEFTTTIRGRTVSCRLEDGTLRGDDELLGRMRRLDPSGGRCDPVSVARLVREAVGSEVTIRALSA